MVLFSPTIAVTCPEPRAGMDSELFIDWSPDARDRASLLGHLSRSNSILAGSADYRALAVIVRNLETGEASSGIWASITYNWLVVELIYVDEDNRRTGVGSRLLAAAEGAAKDLACAGVWLSTYGFQAPGFFEKNGYVCFGSLPGCVPSGTVKDDKLLFYRKQIAAVKR